MARAIRPNGMVAISCASPLVRACRSVRPTPATWGSVKTAIRDVAPGAAALRAPAQELDQEAVVVPRDVGELGPVDRVADGEDAAALVW